MFANLIIDHALAWAAEPGFWEQPQDPVHQALVDAVGDLEPPKLRAGFQKPPTVPAPALWRPSTQPDLNPLAHWKNHLDAPLKVRLEKALKGPLDLPSHVLWPDLGRTVTALLERLGRPIPKNPSLAEEQIYRDAVGFLLMLGISPEKMNKWLPGSMMFYMERRKLHQDPDKLSMGYPWTEPRHSGITQNPLFSEAMNFQPGQWVLDPLTGMGRHLRAAARTYPQSHFIGMDINPQNLSTAAAEGLPNMQLALHDGHDPYLMPDESIDGIVINSWSTFGFSEELLLHFFSEMLRLLKPQGRLWMDFLPFSSPEGLEEVEALLKAARHTRTPLRPEWLGKKLADQDRVFVFEKTAPMAGRKTAAMPAFHPQCAGHRFSGPARTLTQPISGTRVPLNRISLAKH